MSDQRMPTESHADAQQTWGVWSRRHHRWFNAGDRRWLQEGALPQARVSREEAERTLQLAMQQYPDGDWEVRPYRGEPETPAEQSRVV